MSNYAYEDVDRAELDRARLQAASALEDIPHALQRISSTLFSAANAIEQAVEPEDVEATAALLERLPESLNQLAAAWADVVERAGQSR